MMMPGRKFTAASLYRYGFNGKENDNEVKGEGNSLDFGNRMYDSRLGRLFSTDIKSKAYISPYNFSSNNPINMVDPDGNDEIHFHYLNVYIPTPYRRADGSYVLGSKAVTYTWVEVIKDNYSNSYYVHKDAIKYSGNDVTKGNHIKASPTQFYPSTAAFGSPSTGITFSNFLGFDYKDDDYTALLKVMSDFPDLQGKVLPLVFQGAGTSDPKRDFWTKVFSDKRLKSEADAAKQREKDVVVAMVGFVFEEFVVASFLGSSGKLKSLQATFDELAENSLLPKYRQLDPNLRAGYTGSFKTGKVGNPTKATFGNNIDLNNFDIDYWIESDVLYKQFGNKLIPDAEFRKILGEIPGFRGLRDGAKGFSIKIKPLSN